MPRPKIKDENQRLECPVIIRVNKASFERLEKMAKDSGCRTVGEVARRIINGTDRANDIAGYAKRFYDALQDAA